MDSQMPKKLKFWKQSSVREVTGFLTSVIVLEVMVFTKIKNTEVWAALGKRLVVLSLRCLADIIKLFDSHQIISMRKVYSSCLRFADE